MIFAARRILVSIAAAMIGIDAVWGIIGGFDVDVLPYAIVGVLTACLFAGAWYYEILRREPALSAVLFGIGFLVVFGAACGLMNYFALTIAGPRIDGYLAGIDRSLGVNWPDLMAFSGAHPLFNALLWLLYQSVLPQIVVLVTILAWNGKIERIYRFCLSLALGGLMTVSFWTVFPSFGAFSVYALGAKMPLVLDRHYADSLIALLSHGPGHIAPANIKGLVGFPSFHAVQALLIAWFARDIRFVSAGALAINLVVLIATPIQGGHHVVDLLGGLAVTALAIVAAKNLVARVEARSPRGAGIAVGAKA